MGCSSKGTHSKGTKFFCLLEENVDFVLRCNSEKVVDYHTFYYGDNQVIECVNNKAKALLYMINHHPDAKKTNVRLCIGGPDLQEYENERGNLTLMTSVELLKDIQPGKQGAPTEMFYKYDEQPAKEGAPKIKVDWVDQ